MHFFLSLFSPKVYCFSLLTLALFLQTFYSYLTSPPGGKSGKIQKSLDWRQRVSGQSARVINTGILGAEQKASILKGSLPHAFNVIFPFKTFASSVSGVSPTQVPAAPSAVSEIAPLVFDYLDTLSSQRKERLSRLRQWLGETLKPAADLAILCLTASFGLILVLCGEGGVLGDWKDGKKEVVIRR